MPLRLTSILLVTLAACAAHAAPRAPFATQGQCQGLPKLPLKTAAGVCVGLAAQNLGTPRGVLPMADGSVLVVDMGGWDRGKGRVLRLSPQGEGKGYKSSVLLKGLSRPHSLQQGPQGRVLVSEDDRIGSFDPNAAQPLLTPMIDGLPFDGEHPLKSFVLLQDGSLLVNIGSASNNCESAKGQATCPEAEGAQARGALWRYSRAGERWVARPYALGLRNSVALTQDPGTGRIWQADNARDAIEAARGSQASDEDTPHDTLNLLREGAHYGWPYCFDSRRASPEFPSADCSRYEAPLQLLPAHAAPLSLLVYRQDKVPAAWRHVLLIGYHGYRKTGHRIMGLALDEQGLPQRGARWQMLAMGNEQSSLRVRLPMGAPTDFKADAQGHIWVSDDRSGALMRISFEPSPAR